MPHTATQPKVFGAPRLWANWRNPAGGCRPRMHRRFRDYAAPFGVLLLLYAGFFKANPLLSWVPVDLTLLGAVLVLAGVIAVLVRGDLPRGTAVVLAVWATFIPAAILRASTAYGSSKTLYLFTLTLLAALGPLFLIQSERRQETWVVMQIGLGCVLAAGAAVSPVPAATNGSVYRLSLDGSNAIGAGRAAGVAVVGFLVLALVGHRGRGWLLLAGAAVTVPLFLSGSRGPVLAAAAAIAVVAVIAPVSGARRIVRVVLVVVGGFLTWYWLRGETAGAPGRISSTLLAGSTQGTSSQARVMLWEEAWRYIQGHPWGAGWGGLGELSGPSLLGQALYPHDLLLEVGGEAGWIAGIAVIVFLYCGLRRLRAAAVSPYTAALLGMAVFFTVNAMISGDVNDNRTMWASVAIGWVIASKDGTHHTYQSALKMSGRPHEMGSDVTSSSPTGLGNTERHGPVDELKLDGQTKPVRRET